MRVNVSKWTNEGALNVTKDRLPYYYNGFNHTLSPSESPRPAGVSQISI